MKNASLHGRIRATLRKIREEAGFTQLTLAEKLGRPQTFVSKSELGERRVDLAETLEICAACRVSISQFVKRMGKPTPAEAKEKRAKRRTRRKMDSVGRLMRR